MLRLKNIHIIKNILYLSIIFIFLFCSSSGAQREEAVNARGIQDETPVLEESPDAENQERKYIYDPTGKTDPFKSFIVIREPKSEEEEEKRTYLETLELSQLKLSVIVIGNKDRWAMVTDNKGKGHVIKEGTPIGRNRGVVHKIQPGEVIIRESFTNFKGEKDFRDVSKVTK